MVDKALGGAGLRGQVAGETALCTVGKSGSGLTYCGYDISELADKAQFEEERDFPYKQVQYQQSLLQGLPLAAQSYSYSQPSALSQFMDTSGGLMAFLDKLFA